MLLTVLVEGKVVHRTVTRDNIIKVAKSIEKVFPGDYPHLLAMIKNGMDKEMKKPSIIIIKGRK